MRGEELLDWQERGDRLNLATTLDGALEVYVRSESAVTTIVLSTNGCEALIGAVDELAGGRGWVPEIVHEQTLEELGSTQERLDESAERLAALTAELRDRLAEVERLKTANEIADRRARSLERDVDRMRGAERPIDATDSADRIADAYRASGVEVSSL